MAKSDSVERIVILADGTGNAFSTQESNIWRLYQALDLTGPDQVACYIEGVGTSGFRPFAILDGATGIGVPSNVRKLYRFLCWNWRPGVEISMFGFSRGAFTIRTLIGLIDSEGLVPAAFGTEPVSRAEMKRNTMAAWRRYRAKSATFREVAWTVSFTRLVRNAILGLIRAVRKDRSYAEIEAEMAKQSRRTISITFAGLFDTVEAYGVPINELRRAINWALWPISFRNFVMSGIVVRARHALSLDDERTTFHPVRIDTTKEDAAGAAPRIREVWFAGVHSDVGGGYPDDDLAHVPLCWMMQEAEAATPRGGGLRFRDGHLRTALDQASALAPMHDSRAGTSALYRYGPRRTDEPRVGGDSPIVHYAVAEKMVFGTENYAPLTLPAIARVLMPDGTLQPFHGFQARAMKKTGPALVVPEETLEHRAERAVAHLRDPNADYVELTRDTIWWRRVGYFALLAAVLLAVSLPWTASWLNQQLTKGLIVVASLLAPSWAEAWQRHLADAEHGLGSNLNDLSSTLGGFVPSYARAWVTAIVAQPLVSILVLGLAVLLYRLNGSLRDRIADLARCAWFINQQSTGPVVVPRPIASRIARRIRHSTLAVGAVNGVADYLFPACALAALGLGTMVLVERTTVGYRGGAGNLCRASVSEAVLRVPKEGMPTAAASPFTTDNPCWRSGILVEKGRSYTVWIDMSTAYLDRRNPVGVTGFKSSAFPYMLAAPLRRWWSGDWFQPVARIGESGTVEWLLYPVDGESPPELASSRTRKLRWRDLLDWSAIRDKAPSQDSDAAAKLPDIRRHFVATFTAQGTGELFLFLNDVLGAVPFGPTIYDFYLNNSGSANVTVERTPEPKLP